MSRLSRPMTPARYAAAPRPRSITAIALATLLVACGGDAADSAATPAPAPAATVTLVATDLATASVGDITSGILLTGMLEPAVAVQVTAQASGTVGDLRADRGQAVRAGDQLTLLVSESAQPQVAGARAAVAAADANLAVARTRRDAAEKLLAAGAASRVDAENARSVFAAAEAQVAAARAQLTMAEEAAKFTVVTAPITGAVSDRMVETGQAVRVGDALFTVVSTTTLELAGRVPVDEAASIRVGQPVRFSIDTRPGESLEGTVARKDPVADPTSRQVGVYVRLPNANGAITAGQYARGEVAGRTIANAVRIPATAVLGSGDAALVFVLDGSTLQRRPVTVAARDAQSGLVAVTAGVREGERVLVRPDAALADGQAVLVREDPR